MFSKELEELIDAALADGVLTDKERSVLHKRAQAEGIDPDELDVVIEGRLAKIKKETDWLRPTPPQNLDNEKYGNIVRCPNCGSTNVAGKTVCPECGYEFTNIRANRSAERLADQLAAVEMERRNDYIGGALAIIGGGKVAEKVTIIQNFPVPNTRDDLLEFLTMLMPKSSKYGQRNNNMPSEQKIAKAYYVKFSECIDKARRSFANDPDFQPYFEFYEKEEKKWNPMTVFAIVSGVIWVIIIILCLWAAFS